MSKVIVPGPFEEFELTDEHGLQPLAVGHLRLRQSLPPTAALRLRQVRERTLADLQSFELPEQLRPGGRRKAVASSRDVEQAGSLVVAEDQRIERFRSMC